MLFAYPPPIDVPLHVNLWLYLLGVGLLAPALAVLLQFHRPERYTRKDRVAGLLIIATIVAACGTLLMVFWVSEPRHIQNNAGDNA